MRSARPLRTKVTADGQLPTLTLSASPIARLSPTSRDLVVLGDGTPDGLPSAGWGEWTNDGSELADDWGEVDVHEMFDDEALDGWC